MPSPFLWFQSQLQNIRIRCKNISDYHRGGSESGRFWMLPTFRGWDGDPHNIPDMAKPFARDEPNQEYIQEITKDVGGKQSIAMGRKIEIDYMAMMERAFRARQAGPIRCTLHSAGRRLAHSEPAGIHQGGVIKWVQNVLSSGEPPAP
jgi:hypothetical protein